MTSFRSALDAYQSIRLLLDGHLVTPEGDIDLAVLERLAERMDAPDRDIPLGYEEHRRAVDGLKALSHGLNLRLRSAARYFLGEAPVFSTDLPEDETQFHSAFLRFERAYLDHSVTLWSDLRRVQDSFQSLSPVEQIETLRMGIGLLRHNHSGSAESLVVIDRIFNLFCDWMFLVPPAHAKILFCQFLEALPSIKVCDLVGHGEQLTRLIQDTSPEAVAVYLHEGDHPLLNPILYGLVLAQASDGDFEFHYQRLRGKMKSEDNDDKRRAIQILRYALDRLSMDQRRSLIPDTKALSQSPDELCARSAVNFAMKALSLAQTMEEMEVWFKIALCCAFENPGAVRIYADHCLREAMQIHDQVEILSLAEIVFLSFKGRPMQIKDMRFALMRQVFYSAAKLVNGVREVQNKLLSLFWPLMNLEMIEFKCGGKSETPFPDLMENYVQFGVKAFPRLHSVDVPYKRVSTTAEEIVSRFKTIGEARAFHRHRVYQLEGDQGDLMIKFANKGQSGESLVREVQWWKTLEDHGLHFGNDLPFAVHDEDGKVLLFEIDGRDAVAMRVPHDYFYYLDDPVFPFPLFEEGLKRSLRAVFSLARYGVYHEVPVGLYHFWVDGENQRNRAYSVAPGIAFGGGYFGMGEIENWRGCLRWANYALNGLRDGEEMITGDEFEGRVQFSSSAVLAAPVDEMLILGRHLLAATLLLGNRMVDILEKIPDEGRNAWKDDIFLQHYAEILLEVFSEAYAARYELSFERALELMKPRADWLRFSRQMAFFMTKAYIPYVHPDPLKRQPFPESIYGPGVELRGFGPYAEGSWDDELGFIGAPWVRDELNLGANTCQLPIREFEKAMYAVFLDPEVVVKVPDPLKNSGNAPQPPLTLRGGEGELSSLNSIQPDPPKLQSPSKPTFSRLASYRRTSHPAPRKTILGYPALRNMPRRSPISGLPRTYK
ncbi:MAG: hypothetical protein A2048_08225 [Deltaproteobacteria bacterium GWA2_45_12]|nr:MAG: hypothetical protein A2048_08225 [Deltaproteobacteria bacterium GWA2_45_12]